MGNQQSNEIYRQYFPQEQAAKKADRAKFLQGPKQNQLRLATQEEPLEEDEESQDQIELLSDFLQKPHSNRESSLFNYDGASSLLPKSSNMGNINYNKFDLLPEQRICGKNDYCSVVTHDCKKKVHVNLSTNLPELTICIEAPGLTCGWLISEVTQRYVQLVEIRRKEGHTKVKRMIIAALKSVAQNESLDYWLTLYHKTIDELEDGLHLEAHFSKTKLQTKGHTSQICLQDFEPVKVIGKGGFSRVLLVRKNDSGLLFAMKGVQKSAVVGEGKFKQIMSERHIMSKLNHPFIVKLHWAFQSTEELNFVMDLCAGGELFYLLHQYGRLTPDSARFYFAEILLGLEYLHSQGIAYRDLKPENVLLDIEGHAMLADFGLSKALQDQNTLTNSFCGSPEYMSPEMLNGSGHGFAIDYYSLGALLFEMLTGLPPHYSTDRNTMFHQIVESPLYYPEYLDREVTSLLKKLLQKDPIKRWSFEHVDLIKTHPWCRKIVWDKVLLKQTTPPWKPEILKSNFDPEYTSMPLDLFEFQQADSIMKNKGSRRQQQSIYYCMDTSSFCESRTMCEQSGIFNAMNQKSMLGNATINDSGLFFPNSSLMYSSRTKLHDQSLVMQSPSPSHELASALQSIFKGFSFYSEPAAEREVQRQIGEYKKMKMKQKVKRNQLIKQQQKSQKGFINELSPNGQLGKQRRSSATVADKPPKATGIQINNLKKAGRQADLESMTKPGKPPMPPVVVGRIATEEVNAVFTESIDNPQFQIPDNADLEQSTFEEEASIAQEHSLIESESEVDDYKSSIRKSKTVKINSTVESNIHKANMMNSRIFECNSSKKTNSSGKYTHPFVSQIHSSVQSPQPTYYQKPQTSLAVLKSMTTQIYSHKAGTNSQDTTPSNHSKYKQLMGECDERGALERSINGRQTNQSQPFEVEAQSMIQKLNSCTKSTSKSLKHSAFSPVSSQKNLLTRVPQPKVIGSKNSSQNSCIGNLNPTKKTLNREFAIPTTLTSRQDSCSNFCSPIKNENECRKPVQYGIHSPANQENHGSKVQRAKKSKVLSRNSSGMIASSLTQSNMNHTSCNIPKANQQASQLLMTQPKSRNLNPCSNNSSNVFNKSIDNTNSSFQPSNWAVNGGIPGSQTKNAPFNALENLPQGSSQYQSSAGVVRKPPRQSSAAANQPSCEGSLVMGPSQHLTHNAHKSSVFSSTSLTAYQKSKATLAGKKMAGGPSQISSQINIKEQKTSKNAIKPSHTHKGATSSSTSRTHGLSQPVILAAHTQFQTHNFSETSSWNGTPKSITQSQINSQSGVYNGSHVAYTNPFALSLTQYSNQSFNSVSSSHVGIPGVEKEQPCSSLSLVQAYETKAKNEVKASNVKKNLTSTTARPFKVPSYQNSSNANSSVHSFSGQPNGSSSEQHYKRLGSHKRQPQQLTGAPRLSGLRHGPPGSQPTSQTRQGAEGGNLDCRTQMR